MIVRDVMNRNVVVAKPDVTIREAAKVMNTYRIGSLVICEGKKIVGIVTERNILTAVAQGKDLESTLVQDAMTKNVITVEPEDSIEGAVDLMIEHKIKKLPVVEDGKLLGIITASDIVVVEPKLIASIAGLISIKLPGYRGG